MKIYKYQDTIDFNSAYVVSNNEVKAKALMMDQTSIHIELVESRPIEDFPSAKEKLINNKPFIWLNHILPF